MPEGSHYPFRPWVRRTCRRAMLWGVGVVALFGLVAWLFRTPGSAPLARAFGVLTAYGSLFWLTLLKVWWTAGRPAVVVERDALAYQPLHLFRPRRIPYRQVLACGPRAGTQSLRLVVRRGERAREFFLNLAVVKGAAGLLDELGERLESAGLEATGTRPPAWRRRDWHEP